MIVLSSAVMVMNGCPLARDLPLQPVDLAPQAVDRLLPVFKFAQVHLASLLQVPRLPLVTAGRLLKQKSRVFGG